MKPLGFVSRAEYLSGYNIILALKDGSFEAAKV